MPLDKRGRVRRCVLGTISGTGNLPPPVYGSYARKTATGGAVQHGRYCQPLLIDNAIAAMIDKVGRDAARRAGNDEITLASFARSVTPHCLTNLLRKLI